MATGYDARLARVSNALKDVGLPRYCFTSGSYSQFPPPGLAVDGLGELASPLAEFEARKLISISRPAMNAPSAGYSELASDQLHLKNPDWTEMIDTIVSTVGPPLGINNAIKLKAQLRKLSVYEPGGMSHKDQGSDNVPGGFGTLVVILPSRFEGGDLHVQHQNSQDGATHVLDPGAMSPYHVKYAAFYSDCEQEVKPVTSGYRLCLTYNLTAAETTCVPRFAGSHVLPLYLLSSLELFFLEEGESDHQPPSKRPRLAQQPIDSGILRQRDCQLVYMLGHQYKEPQLSFDCLKNKDQLIAQALAKFCEEKQQAFNLFLSKVVYTDAYDRDNPEHLLDERLELESPWIPYGAQSSDYENPVTACVESEVAPAGFFDDVDHDGIEEWRDEVSRWYSSAALILQPVSYTG